MEFIPSYNVYYTTELVVVDRGDFGIEEEEREVAHISTSNSTLSHLLEEYYRPVYRFIICFFFFLSLKINLIIRKKHNVIIKKIEDENGK